MYALLAASGSPISEAKHTAVLLAGLSAEFDAVVSFVSLSSTPLPFQRVVDALVDCEARQERSVQDVLLSANLVEGSVQGADSSSPGSSCNGCPLARGRGRDFHPRVQCQICSRFGHLTQRCYYRYYRDEQLSTNAPVVSQGGSVFGVSRDDWGRSSRFQQEHG